MRLDKYLSEMGVGTRSEIKKSCKAGLVTVDGIVIKDSSLKIDENTAKVSYRGISVTYEEFVYYMMNKPSGVISASDDNRESTVVDLIDEQKRKDLFPVGRLDRDTEGLLMITNDGELAHRLLSPKHHVDKVYYAKILGVCTNSDVEAFRDGLIIDDGLVCMPADLKILITDSEENVSEIEITIREGKFHQVKRMFQAVGKEVLYLKRLSMGPLQLDNSLESGEYRRLTTEEIVLLKSL